VKRGQHAPVAKHRGGARGGKDVGSWGASGRRSRLGTLGGFDRSDYGRSSVQEGQARVQATEL
jgi:hypothetical protein